LILGICASLVAAGVATAQVKKGKTRVMKTGQLMKAVVKPNCGALKKGLEAAPASDEAWDDLAAAAAVLNEASFILMDDGRCPDAVWADAASKTLRNSSADLLKAIEAKDHSAAKAAFGNLMGSCKACHEKHKEKK
jgi:cytochrome c556